MTQTKFDAVIIDLDGALIDIMGDFVAAINLMLPDMGLSPVDRSVVGPWVGKGSEYLVKSVSNSLPAQLNRARAAINKEANFESALVTYGYNHGEPVRRADADGYVDSLADLCLLK